MKELGYMLGRLGLGVGLVSFAALAAAPTNQMEIVQHRFSRNARKGNERLVLQFNLKDQGVTKPIVQVASKTPESLLVTVDQASLVGSIPEAKINASFGKRTTYVGAVSFSAEGPGQSFSVLVELKKPAPQANAFWLDSPSRLVIDLQGRGGGSVPQGRNIASLGNDVLAMALAAPKMGPDILCFPADSRVAAAITFQPKTTDSLEARPERTETPTVIPPAGGGDSQTEAVVCYPASAQLRPDITFMSRTGQVATLPSVRTVVAPVDLNGQKIPAVPPNSVLSSGTAAIPMNKDPNFASTTGSLPGEEKQLNAGATPANAGGVPEAGEMPQNQPPEILN